MHCNPITLTFDVPTGTVFGMYPGGCRAATAGDEAGDVYLAKGHVLWVAIDARGVAAPSELNLYDYFDPATGRVLIGGHASNPKPGKVTVTGVAAL